MYDNAPGCYGSPLCRDERLPICSMCEYAESCESEAVARAIRLRNQFGITSLLSVRARSHAARDAEAALSQPVLVSAANGVDIEAKAEAIERGLARRGINLAAAVSEGSNPFDRNPPAWLRYAVDLLMRRGGFTRSELRRLLIDKMKWDEAAASLHVTLVISLFQRTGAGGELKRRIVSMTELSAVA